MINLLRSEWIKLRSVRSTLILLLAAGVLVVFFAVIAANNVENTCVREVKTEQGRTYTDQQPCDNVANNPAYTPQPTHLGDVTVGVTVAIFLFGTLGVQVIGQEYRFNTIRPTFTAVPRRFRVLIAKLVVVAIAAAVVSAVMVAICAVVGTVTRDSFAIDSTDHRVIFGTLLFAMGWTMYGMGLGAIVRQPVAGIVILLIQGLIAEPLLASQVRWLGPWMPFQNGVQMTGREPGDPDMFRSIFAGGVYFFLFTFVLWGIGAYLVNKRDA
jgi:ABC-2 type transport system permease protein